MVDVTELPASPSDILFGALDALPGPAQSLARPPVARGSLRAYATEDEWEKHRDEIKGLYLRQDKKLHEVKAAMESQHSFFATWVTIACLPSGLSLTDAPTAPTCSRSGSASGAWTIRTSGGRKPTK